MKFFERKKKHSSHGQAIMEFTFSMIVLLIMIYATIKVFRWSGVDLAERRRAHDTLLKSTIDPNWGDPICSLGTDGSITCTTLTDYSDGPMQQIDPYFYNPISINAVFDLK